MPALFGFCIFLTIFNQLVSGVMLSLGFITESMFIPLAREEEDCENLYTDDFFWLHERGVDLLVIFIFLHLLRKFYLNTMSLEQEYAWKSGVLLFLLAQFVIFSGLTLCCTHLSDITLTIATNAFHSFCLFVGKLYWLIFPDQTLNSDTVTRLAYLHYITAFLLAYYGVYHGVDMHYDWKADESHEFIKFELNWFDEALLNEIGQFLNIIIFVGLFCVYLYTEPEALNYEIFMWGDVGMQVDVRFFGVAPHWYFRPYMSWLIACPFHYTGLIGLILFFTGFYFQPNILNYSEFQEYYSIKAFFTSIYYWVKGLSKKLINLSKVSPEKEWYYQVTYIVMSVSLWYVFYYLPFGRFFNRLGGTGATLLALIYLFVYMSSTYLRIPKIYNAAKLISVNG